jgi:type IV pilus assembly protein PilQ
LILSFLSGQGPLEATADPVPADSSEFVGEALVEPTSVQIPVETLAREDLPALPGKESDETPPSEPQPLFSDPSPAPEPALGHREPGGIPTLDEAWQEHGVREEVGEGYTRVVFSDIIGPSGYRYSFLDDPPRLVVDITVPAREVRFNRLALKGSAFEQVRAGRHPDKLRLVLDCREEGQPEPLVEADQGDLVVLASAFPKGQALSRVDTPLQEVPEPAPQAVETAALESATAFGEATYTGDPNTEPIPMGGPEVPITLAQADWKPVRVQGIDFRQTESASELIIATDGATPYDVEERDDSIVVTLPGAQIPDHLQWPIDTRAFPSAVLSVKPEQVGSGPTGKVELTIRLRQKRPYNVLEEERGLRVSVLLPETPPEIPLLPPPALPETEGAAKIEPPPPPEPEAAQQVSEVKAPEPEAAPAETAPRQPETAPEPEVKTPEPYISRAAMANYKGKKISLDFKDADIKNVLRLIAEVSEKNIVISDAVQGKVTIRLLNVPWDMALDVLLKTYALEKEELGPNILRVAPYAQLKREREEALRAEEALEKVESLETRVVPVNYAKAADLETMLGRIKSKRPDATILVDSRTNSLIIRDLPLNIREMTALVRSLDTQTPQVLIEAKIVELDVEYEQELGIQWGTLYQAGPATGNPTGLNFPATANVGGVVDNISGKPVAGIANPVVNLPAAVDDTAGGALGFSLASITNSFQLDAQLSALEKRRHARILSSPRVATLSNQEAKINQGQEVPFQTTSDEGTKTEFKDAKLQLSVTPQITFDRSIIMNIVVTNDTPIRDPTVGFIIGTKEAKTTVLVKDADTAVIGGIYTNNDSDSEGGIPVLMDLPVAGYLFKKKTEGQKRTELVIFITPRIIPSQQIQFSDWAEEENTGDQEETD